MYRVILTQAQYDALSAPKSDTFYLIKGTGRAYIGTDAIQGTWRTRDEALMSIAITAPPTKVNYISGEALDLTGLQVTGTFLDGHHADITSTCTYVPAAGTPITIENKTIHAICQSKLATYELNILVTNS